MEILTLDGKEYLKAKSAARELGYTADYIGQLCRAGKIDSRLVGRSWYVDVKELSSHKESKYGTKGTKEIKVKTQKGAEKSESVTIHKVSSLNTTAPKSGEEFKKHVYWNAPRYENDQESLIPPVKKEFVSNGIKITVTPTDATAIKVGSVPGETYRMTATDLPEVRLKGVLRINSLEEDTYEDMLSKESDSVEVEPPTRVVPLANSAGVIGMKRASTVSIKEKSPSRPLPNVDLKNPTTSPEMVTSVPVKSKVEQGATPVTKRPLSRFEQRVTAKITEAPDVPPIPTKPEKMIAHAGNESTEILVENLNPALPNGQDVVVNTRLAPYVLTAVVMAVVTLSVIFSLDSVVISNDITTKYTVDFNLASIYEILFP